MRPFLFCMIVLLTCSCKNSVDQMKDPNISAQEIDTALTKDIVEFKILDSKFLSNSGLWQPFEHDLEDFNEAQYQTLKPLILESDISTLQNHIQDGQLTYENLVKFYLYRIRKFDRENERSLNAVISLNPNVVSEAKQRDEALRNKMRKHPIFGMPILLKDNINAIAMATTSGAVALQNNHPDNDAFVVSQLKSHGALILGKVNLSEWAYFFCGDCPSGYSAIGGQTLNPYGRRVMDTGGSSSGSGVAVAANFCVASIGTETSGSILSPSGQNSTVGIKPTVGLLSRSGIVPISSTLDTPGPMAKNVMDTAIVLDAMLGYDQKDFKSVSPKMESLPLTKIDFNLHSLENKRFGAFKELMKNDLYAQAIEHLKSKGAVIVEIEEEKIELPDFLRLLNLDMKNDFEAYVKAFGDPDLSITSIADVMAFNKQDSTARMPYGQKLFAGIVADSATDKDFQMLKNTLKTNGKLFFDVPMQNHNLAGILSINNYHAQYAAVAEYPAITVPMGYSPSGKPEGVTFISTPFSELELLNWAYVYEHETHKRKAPRAYN